MNPIQIPSTEKRRSRTELNRALAVTVFAAAVTLGFGQAGIVAPAVAQEKMTAPAPAEAKPNILFIMGDDIGYMQPSIYHEGLAVGETPNIDRARRRKVPDLLRRAELHGGTHSFYYRHAAGARRHDFTGNSEQPLLSADGHAYTR